MPRVPFIGRLFLHEYLALLGSLVLIGLEGVIRIITQALPRPIIVFFYNRSRTLFDFLSSPQGRRSRARRSNIVKDIRDASDFVEMCALYGYYAEENIVQTADGYLLGLHRLGWRKGEERQRVNSGPDSLKKPVIYLHHGLLMNSEVWVCITESERCLPFQLVEKGYDVWLGNNRGNKYSKKSTTRSPTSTWFWNFSMDEFAFHDIPNSISYVLETTGQASLSYIGFSQGTAQAFASLSIHPKLNDQVDVFIALAPAMAPARLSNGVVNALIKASPEVIFLAFGRRSILSSAIMWQSILYPPIFVRIIDIGISFLFNWHARNISSHQKLAAYPHLYSFTSTKSVVHWFQIIRNQSFQMYDDDVQAPWSLGGSNKYYKVARFPTKNIKTPVVLLYGGSDSLVDIRVMLKQLPNHTVAIEVPHFEHLDFLWGNDVDKLVFPHVFDALESYADSSHLKEKPLGSRTVRYSLTGPPSYYSEDERISFTGLLSGGVSNGDIRRPRNVEETRVPDGLVSTPKQAAAYPLVDSHDITTGSVRHTPDLSSSSAEKALPAIPSEPQPTHVYSHSLGVPSIVTASTPSHDHVDHASSVTTTTPSTTASPQQQQSHPILHTNASISNRPQRTSSISGSSIDSISNNAVSSTGTNSASTTRKRTNKPKPGFRAQGIALGFGRPVMGGVITGVEARSPTSTTATPNAGGGGTTTTGESGTGKSGGLSGLRKVSGVVGNGGGKKGKRKE